MFVFLKASRRLALTAGLVVLPLTAALAQAPQIAVPQVVVPQPPGQQHTSFEGCYAINQYLYGPYRMSFCLNRNGAGSYRVTGGGLNCNGWVNWWERRGGSAQVNLQYSTCGHGVGWSADTMVCSAQQTQWPPFQPFPGPWGGPGQYGPGPNNNGPNARIAVPDYPSSNSLRCTYQPAVRGYQPISVIANRTH
jgi:hypothetical protein